MAAAKSPAPRRNSSRGGLPLPIISESRVRLGGAHLAPEALALRLHSLYQPGLTVLEHVQCGAVHRQHPPESRGLLGKVTLND